MSNPIPMNNDKHTLGKAVLSGRLNAIIRRQAPRPRRLQDPSQDNEGR